MFSWLIKCFLNYSVSFAHSVLMLSIYLVTLVPIFITSSSIYLLKKWALSAESWAVSLTSFISFYKVLSDYSLIPATSTITFLINPWMSCLLSLSDWSLLSTSILIISLSFSVTYTYYDLNPSTSYLMPSATFPISVLKLISYWVLESSSCLTQPFIVLICVSKLFCRAIIASSFL